MIINKARESVSMLTQKDIDLSLFHNVNLKTLKTI